MEKEDKKFSGNQPDLFQQLEGRQAALYDDNAPDLDIEFEFIGAVKYAIREAKKHGVSRDRIVDRMNQCLPTDKHITKRQLDSWTANSKEYHKFPAEYLPAFVWAVRGVISAIEVLTRALGLHVIDETEYLATELGKTVTRKAALAVQERILKTKLGTG
ncbi:MAG TPA: hypothetical protein ENI80_03500 [Acidiferrobacteraceae bacterium]|nr:hypothetical protein [Acidiferrobacteraceae bacterium]